MSSLSLYLDDEHGEQLEACEYRATAARLSWSSMASEVADAEHRLPIEIPDTNANDRSRWLLSGESVSPGAWASACP